jgi:hypothetical protein
MNKPNKREGFVSSTEPVDESPSGPVIDHEPATADAPSVVEEAWPVKVKLMHKPIRGPKGNMIQELSFREPTGGDINRYGNPCMVDQNGDVVILDRKMTTMIAVLSGVLQPFIETMDPRDWNSCAYRLRGFFIPDPAAW